MKSFRPCKRLPLAALLSLALLGCSGNTPEALIASAKGYLDKNEVPAAIIQLKNALQKQPESAEARFLLGTTLLRTGDAPGASIELRKALAAGHPADLVAPPMARSLLLAGDTKALTEELAQLPLAAADAVADVQTSVALAHFALGKTELGAEALAKARRAVPDYPRANIAEARLEASRKNYARALTLVETAIAAQPLDHEAWILKGDVLLHDDQNRPEALDAYRRAVSLKHDDAQGHRGILTVLFAAPDESAAAAALAAMQQALPKHPLTRYFEAYDALRKRDLPMAKQRIDQVLAVAPDSPEALLLAAGIEGERGAHAQAERHLGRLVAVAPTHTTARRMLAETYVRNGQPDKAIALLEELVRTGKPTADLLALQGQALLLDGDAKAAEALFARAAQLDPEHVRSRVALSLARIAKGDTETGLATLKGLAAKDKTTFADMALISVHLGRKEWTQALAAIGTLEAKQPKQPNAAFLRGNVLLAKQDEAAARRSFEQALTIDPLYLPAVVRLAALDLSAKQDAAARKRFANVLAADPANTRAQLALAALDARSGSSDKDVADQIAAAVRLGPEDPLARRMLVQHHLRSKDSKAALAAAQEAVAALPDNPDLLESLGLAQAADGQTNQAVSTFNKLATLEPRSPRAHLRLAGLHRSGKNIDAAIQSLQRALAISPRLLEAQAQLTGLYVETKRPKDALALARLVQKQRPDEAAGHALEGDVEAAAGNWDAALAAYRTGLEAKDGTHLSARVHATLTGAGRTADADRFAAQWIASHSKDTALRFQLAQIALQKDDYAAAGQHLKTVVDLQPNNAVALNNLAWALHKSRQAGAKAYAEKALTLRPDEPSMLDTMAAILAGEQQYGKALELQQKAVRLQPANHALRLQLARLQIATGSKDAARTELQTLSKVTEPYAGQAEVAELMRSL